MLWQRFSHHMGGGGAKKIFSRAKKSLYFEETFLVFAHINWKIGSQRSHKFNEYFQVFGFGERGLRSNGPVVRTVACKNNRTWVRSLLFPYS